MEFIKKNEKYFKYSIIARVGMIKICGEVKVWESMDTRA